MTLHLTTTGGGLCHAGYSVCNVTTCAFSFLPFLVSSSAASSLLQFRHVSGTDRETRGKKKEVCSRQQLATAGEERQRGQGEHWSMVPCVSDVAGSWHCLAFGDVPGASGLGPPHVPCTPPSMQARTTSNHLSNNTSN